MAEADMALEEVWASRYEFAHEQETVGSEHSRANRQYAA